MLLVDIFLYLFIFKVKVVFEFLFNFIQFIVKPIKSSTRIQFLTQQMFDFTVCLLHVHSLLLYDWWLMFFKCIGVHSKLIIQVLNLLRYSVKVDFIFLYLLLLISVDSALWLFEAVSITCYFKLIQFIFYVIDFVKYILHSIKLDIADVLLIESFLLPPLEFIHRFYIYFWRPHIITFSSCLFNLSFDFSFQEVIFKVFIQFFEPWRGINMLLEILRMQNVFLHWLPYVFLQIEFQVVHVEEVVRGSSFSVLFKIRFKQLSFFIFVVFTL